MILVTGATGHLGGAAIDFLLKKVPANTLAALVRTADKGQDLAQKGIALRIGNYHDRASLATAFAGIDALLFISSGDTNDRVTQHLNVVKAAAEAGVSFIAYTGVAATKTEGSVFQWFLDDHFKTDQAIRDSGMRYALLHHTLYGDFLPAFTGEKAADTGIHLPAGTGKVPYAARIDMAEAAANVLTGDTSESREYIIGAGTAYSFSDVAEQLAALSGQPVAYTDIPEAAFHTFLESISLPPDVIALSAGFVAAIKAGELDTPADDLEKLLGRKPKGLAEIVKEAYGL